MTKIEDMSKPEQHSWIVMLADGAVFLYFWGKMTRGLSLQPQNYSFDQFSGLVLRVVVLTVIFHVVISVIFDARRRRGGASSDERDIMIGRKGSQYGYYILQGGVGVLTVMLLMHQGFGDEYTPPILYSTPVEIIFFLIMLSYIADLVKHGVMIAAYRQA